jgi:uncharacterized protein YqeY
MDKRTELTTALKEAMKAREDVAIGTIRLIIAAMKDRDIEARGHGRPEGVTDTEILSMMQSMIKQRQESSATYKGAGRTDLSDREDAEIKIIERFLPQQMGDAEIKKTVETLLAELNVTDVRDMGKVMAEMKKRYAGQLDMARASGLVKEKLAG